MCATAVIMLMLQQEMMAEKLVSDRGKICIAVLQICVCELSFLILDEWIGRVGRTTDIQFVFPSPNIPPFCVCTFFHFRGHLRMDYGL
jgi:hypothetical protein